MTFLEEDQQDAALPDLAVRALAAATDHARRAGYTLVFVKNGRLIRKGPDGDVVLKPVPRRVSGVESLQKIKVMNGLIPRLRMFAGPNGSGKTTIKNGISRPPDWFGIYVNPDELEF